MVDDAPDVDALLADPATDPETASALRGEPLVVGYEMAGRYDEDFPVRGYTFGYAELLGVRRASRGRRVAVAALAAAMRAFAADGMQYAALDVDTENPSGAHGLYASLGYEKVTGWRMYSIELERPRRERSQRRRGERVAVLEGAVLVAGREPALALLADPSVQPSGFTWPVAASWMRSSPTADAADSASSSCCSVIGARNVTPVSGSTVVAAWPAHMPARQSAMSSMRTESDSGVPCRSAESMAPVSCSMWCPNSCATTYISASPPSFAPKRFVRSS